MTQRPTLVRIASPCHESWAAMIPTATGRHCAACQKTVVDFTQKTDAEILATLRQAAGETCGRLRLDQVGRPLVAPTAAPRWRTWLGAVLAISSGLNISKASAQASGRHASGRPALVVSPSPSQRNYAVTGAPMLLLDEGPVVLRGTIKDARTHEGVAGATVLLKGTAIGTSADANGAFALPLEAAGPSATIAVSMIGYVSQEQTLTLGSSAPVKVELLLDTRVLGGLLVVDYKSPWPWHPRRFFNWSKYFLINILRNK